MKMKKKTKKVYKKVKESDVKKVKQKRKPYFGKDAHAAVVEYQAADCRNTRHIIYEEKIRPSFEKLAENLIFIHNFSTSKEHFHVLKSDTVSFLYEILEKFDPSRGSKAFSYFNVCAKNFLIIQSKKRTKQRNRHISIDDESLSLREKSQIEMSQVIPSQEDMMIKQEEHAALSLMLKRIKEKVSNQNEILCIDSVITLFNKVDELDFLNKRAVFVYLREISGLNPKQLSVSMSSLRKHWREHKRLVKYDEDFFDALLGSVKDE